MAENNETVFYPQIQLALLVIGPSLVAVTSYLLFSARLHNLLQYYLSSKNVGNNFDKLCNVNFAD